MTDVTRGYAAPPRRLRRRCCGPSPWPSTRTPPSSPSRSGSVPGGRYRPMACSATRRGGVAFEGGRLVERATDGTAATWGEVVVWDRPRRLVFTWHRVVTVRDTPWWRSVSSVTRKALGSSSSTAAGNGSAESGWPDAVAMSVLAPGARPRSTTSMSSSHARTRPNAQPWRRHTRSSSPRRSAAASARRRTGVGRRPGDRACHPERPRAMTAVAHALIHTGRRCSRMSSVRTAPSQPPTSNGSAATGRRWSPRSAGLRDRTGRAGPARRGPAVGAGPLPAAPRRSGRARPDHAVGVVADDDAGRSPPPGAHRTAARSAGYLTVSCGDGSRECVGAPRARQIWHFADQCTSGVLGWWATPPIDHPGGAMTDPAPEPLAGRTFTDRTVRAARFIGCDLSAVVVRGSDVAGMEIDSRGSSRATGLSRSTASTSSPSSTPSSTVGFRAASCAPRKTRTPSRPPGRNSRPPGPRHWSAPPRCLPARSTPPSTASGPSPRPCGIS